jgi:hypothetical protein
MFIDEKPSKFVVALAGFSVDRGGGGGGATDVGGVGVGETGEDGLSLPQAAAPRARMRAAGIKFRHTPRRLIVGSEKLILCIEHSKPLTRTDSVGL